jgi:hypothetical protein
LRLSTKNIIAELPAPVNNFFALKQIFCPEAKFLCRKQLTDGKEPSGKNRSFAV